MNFTLRAGCYLTALAVGFGGLFGGPWMPALRQGDGWLAPQAWAVVVVGLAIAVAGHGWHRRWRTSAWLFALALIGQAAALQLIFAPPYGIYQHVRTLGEIGGSWRLFCLIAILAQGLYVGGASRRVWPLGLALGQHLPAALRTGEQALHPGPNVADGLAAGRRSHRK